MAARPSQHCGGSTVAWPCPAGVDDDDDGSLQYLNHSSQSVAVAVHPFLAPKDRSELCQDLAGVVEC